MILGDQGSGGAKMSALDSPCDFLHFVGHLTSLENFRFLTFGDLGLLFFRSVGRQMHSRSFPWSDFQELLGIIGRHFVGQANLYLLCSPGNQYFQKIMIFSSTTKPVEACHWQISDFCVILAPPVPTTFVLHDHNRNYKT